MRYIILLIFFSLRCTEEKKPVELKQSNPKLIAELCWQENCLQLANTKDQSIYYRIALSKKEILTWSKLGIQSQPGPLDKAAKILSVKKSDVYESYTLNHGKQSLVSVKGKKILTEFETPTGLTWGIEIYGSDDGFALRYRLPKEENLLIEKEFTEFRFSEKSTLAYLQEYQKASLVTPSYEAWYEKMPVNSKDRGKLPWYYRILNPLAEHFGWNFHGTDGFAFPGLFRTGQYYLLLTETDLNKEYCASHFKLNIQENAYEIAFPEKAQAEGDGEALPIMNKIYQTPWRVFILGSLDKVFASTLVTDLVPLGKKAPWAKPGKVTWDWWAYQRTGGPERQKAYIKAAANFSWDYTLIDANWNKWDMPYEKLKDLVDYAKSLNIGLLLWYNSGGANNRIMEGPRGFMSVRELRRKEFAKISSLGIKGIKIDFFHSDKPKHIKQMIETLEDAHDYKLMVNFHGATVPRGLRRRFPHLMTVEGVKGAEWYQFPVFRGPSALDHVRYTFTRNVIGPMDYTPLVFKLPFKQQKITYAHSLALGVLFESGLQHFADIADQEDKGYRTIFKKHPKLKNFLAQLPVSWDESKLLAGSPDDYVVVARRKGKKWFIAGISGLERKLEIDLDFKQFCETKCQVLGIVDSEEKESLTFTKLKLNKITMKAKGGFIFETL